MLTGASFLGRLEMAPCCLEIRLPGPGYDCNGVMGTLGAAGISDTVG